MDELLQILRPGNGACLVRFLGTIDERFTRGALASITERVVLFDMEGVKKITSFGVREWLEALRGLKAEYYAFARCRPAVVAQFNMVSGFLGKGHVLSFYAPYTCPNCSRDLDLLLGTRENYQLLAARQFPGVKCPECNAAAVFDDLPGAFLSFLTVSPQGHPQVEPLLSSLASMPSPKSPGRRQVVASSQSASSMAAANVPKPAVVQRQATPFMPGVRPRLLLVEPDENRAERIAQVLRVSTKVEIAPTLPSQSNCDIALLNFDGLSAAEQARLYAAPPTGRGSRRLLLYTADRTRQTMMTLLEKLGLVHILANNGEVDGEELYVSVYKLVSGEFFGLDKYFSWGARAIERRLRNSREKQEAIAAAVAFAEDAGLQQRMVDLFSLVAEELLTNALYDAPVDGRGNHRFAHYSRDREVQLDAHENIYMTLCCDGRRIGISVLDPFGSLPPDKIASYLVKCFQKGENQVDRKEGGAGLGLFYTLEAVSHLSAGIAPGRGTEMIGLVDLRGTYRDFAARGKSLSVFVSESGSRGR